MTLHFMGERVEERKRFFRRLADGRFQIEY